MIFLIYNKRENCGASDFTFTFSGVSKQEKCGGESRDGTNSSSDFAKTREMSNLSEFDSDDIMPYLPIRVKKSRIRREMRRIRREKQRCNRSFFQIALSFCICICVCSVTAYLAYSGTYAPKELCYALGKICSYIYPADQTSVFFQSSKSDMSQSRYFSGVPEYLSQSPDISASKATEYDSQEQNHGASDGESINASEGNSLTDGLSENYAQSNTVAADTQILGKSGADGEVYLPLVTKDMRAKDLHELSNQTKLNPDISSLLKLTPKAFENLNVSDEPLVLVLHTHATETYSEAKTSAASYKASEPTRTDDTDKNVVRVGQELCNVLCDFGIKTLHCEVLHDKESFINAYGKSYESVSEYLKQYPSIRFVIDLHRDAIYDGDSKIKPTFSIANESYAQLMFVVGTDASYGNHPDWQDNLTLALKLQSAAEQMYPGLFRKINLRTASFNQQLSSGYLLLEAGSCGNNLQEALRSVKAFGTVLAGEILKNAN